MRLVAVAVPWLLGVKLGVVDDPQGVTAVVGHRDRDRMAGCPNIA
ncbi:hypothetical protein [Mycolicibacterium sp. CR10]|nr:hypothetical protein [Mycolicibacterium sp. CR10]